MPDPWRIDRDGDHWFLIIPGITDHRGQCRYGPYSREILPVVEAHAYRSSDDGVVLLEVHTDLQRRVAEVLGFKVNKGVQ